MTKGNPLFQFVAIVLVSLFIVAGCAGTPVAPNPSRTYRESVEELDLLRSFGFAFQGHDYNFVWATTDGFQNSCSRIDGFQDNRLTYSFSTQSLEPLGAIYSGAQGIETKISLAARFIEKISPRFIECVDPPKLGFFKKLDNVVGDGLAFIIYGTVVLIAAPITVPYMANEILTEKQLLKKLRRVHLGDSVENVRKNLDAPFTSELVDGHIVDTFDIPKGSQDSWQRLVFVFKEKKLVAYVWGLRPKS